jgi:glutathione S-transferase
MKPRLYLIPASPPCYAVEAALRAKGIAYDVTELPNVLHIPHQLVRFRAPYVPAMRLDGERVVTSTAILRRLDELVPEPPMYPSPRVEEVEAYVVEALQPIARRTPAYVAVHHNRSSPTWFSQARVKFPDPAYRVMIPAIGRLGLARNGGARVEAIEADIRALPGVLERLDAFIDDGVFGGDVPNAADLQVGSNLALLLRIGDLEPVIRAHERAAAVADRWFPDYPGRVPPGVLPLSGTGARS